VVSFLIVSIEDGFGEHGWEAFCLQAAEIGVTGTLSA
jgi:hypothetical protein